jgi:hypothetical protein
MPARHGEISLPVLTSQHMAASVITLGARRRKMEYTAYELRALQDVIQVVAGAIEQDRQ